MTTNRFRVWMDSLRRKIAYDSALESSTTGDTAG